MNLSFTGLNTVGDAKQLSDTVVPNEALKENQKTL
jgi:hypothetical protein